MEQSLEWNASLYNTFLDFEKAFDIVNLCGIFGVNMGIEIKS